MQPASWLWADAVQQDEGRRGMGWRAYDPTRCHPNLKIGGRQGTQVGYMSPELKQSFPSQ